MDSKIDKNWNAPCWFRSRRGWPCGPFCFRRCWGRACTWRSWRRGGRRGAAGRTGASWARASGRRPRTAAAPRTGATRAWTAPWWSAAWPHSATCGATWWSSRLQLRTREKTKRVITRGCGLSVRVSECHPAFWYCWGDQIWPAACHSSEKWGILAAAASQKLVALLSSRDNAHWFGLLFSVGHRKMWK